MDKLMEKEAVKSNIEENVEYLHKELGVGKSFDIIQLELEYAETKMAMFLVDGLVKDDLLHLLMKFFAKMKKEEIEKDTLQKLLRTYIPYVEIDTQDNLNEVVDGVLSGPTALVVDGIDQVIMIDARTYPVRGPEEPDTRKSCARCP